MYGERFDLMREGTFTLINIPRGQPAHDALLVVDAKAQALGGQCSDMYFVRLNITGAWANTAQAHVFHANGARDEKPKWSKFGPVELKIVHGITDKGARYLNFYVKHLGRAGFEVGGLLGADDHTDAAMPTQMCHKALSIWRATDPADNRQSKSVAEAESA